jgi:molybdopterin converting factor small subunit
MAVNTQKLAEKIFNLLKGYGYAVQSYDAQGKLVVDPQQATRFLVDDPNILVRLDLTNMQVSLATSEDLSDDPLRTQLKRIVYNTSPEVTFDYKVFGKKLKAKGEAINIVKNSERDMADVMEGFGTMTGSTKTSYQPLDNIKIVVKHKKPVNEESRGARSRNIHSIYIQRGEEKFKMQENSLKAARAMARHMHNGGEMFDTVGQSITEMAAEYRQLGDFVRYVRSANLVNENNEQYVHMAVENIESIRTMFDKLSGVKTYATAVESLEDRYSVEILEDSVDLESKFVETHFDDRVANALDSIKRAMARQQSFEGTIVQAVANETFANLKDMLSENDAVDFETPHARLGHQVAQMGYAAQNPVLGNYLQNLSKKLASGTSLNQFEYTTIKSCLLCANEAQVKPMTGMSESESYEKFLEQFIID